MATHDYHFVTQWRVEGNISEVFDIISDSTNLARWWPSVYLDVQQTEPGGKNSIGRELALHTKGWLPYTLRWTLRVLENEPPHHMAIGARGDFEGRGVWTLEQEGDQVHVTFDWRIAAEKPLLKYLSFALKPVFARNHEWAMRRGLESLNLEIQRRRAATATERDRVPDPPGPTVFDARIGAGVLLGATLLVFLAYRRRDRIKKSQSKVTVKQNASS